MPVLLIIHEHPSSITGEWIPAGIPIHLDAVVDDVAIRIHTTRTVAAVVDDARRADFPPAGIPIYTDAVVVVDATIREHTVCTVEVVCVRRRAKFDFYLK